MRTWAAGRKPDLVDRIEIGERLGVSRATVSRWHRRAILPYPDLTLGEIDMWKWETIEEWAKDRSRFARRSRRSSMPDLVDIPAIADRLEINQRTIENWHRNKRLPVPDYKWAAGEVWLWETIDEWQQTQLAGRSLGLPQRAERHVTVRPSEPSGPKLVVKADTPPPPVEPAPPVQQPPGAAAPPPAPSPAGVDHRIEAPVRPVASPAKEPVAPPAVAVTVAREPSDDPIGDLERLAARFGELAEDLRVS